MTLSIKNISKTIRFRRWSRYQFAAFQSIGKCVNIGCVCKSKEIDDHSKVHNKRICKDGPVFNAEDIEI